MRALVSSGSFDLLADSGPYDDDGYIGAALSRADGTFAAPPTITVSFSKVYETYLEGVTITWGAAYDGECADTFTITAYNGATVAAWVRDLLLNRQTLSGTWRADPKTDVLDTVTVDTPFKTNRTVLTSVELTFNGAWNGSYEGRVVP